MAPKLENATLAILRRVLNFQIKAGTVPGKIVGVFVHLNKYPYSFCLNPHVTLVFFGRFVSVPMPEKHWLYEMDLDPAKRRFLRSIRKAFS